MRILFSLHQNDQCGAATFRAAPAPEVREVLEPTLTKLGRLWLLAKKATPAPHHLSYTRTMKMNTQIF